MSQHPARIRWYSPEEGGRSVPLPCGIKYYPLIELDDFSYPEGVGWSVWFFTTPTNKEGICHIALSLLVDDVPGAIALESHFLPGSTFRLLEGYKAVAEGSFLG